NPLPGITDRFGHIGTDANLVAPGKRMLSSQSPVIVAREGKVVLVTGSPGGRTIPNTVLDILVNVIDFGLNGRQAVDAPRVHHQWLPDRIVIEPGLGKKHPDSIDRLKSMGHAITVDKEGQGDAHTIMVDIQTGKITGVADHRRAGEAAGH